MILTASYVSASSSHISPKNQNSPLAGDRKHQSCQFDDFRLFSLTRRQQRLKTSKENRPEAVGTATNGQSKHRRRRRDEDLVFETLEKRQVYLIFTLKHELEKEAEIRELRRRTTASEDEEGFIKESKR